MWVTYFSRGSECCTCKASITDVVYNASNSELVHTETLVKNRILPIDSTRYWQWDEPHNALPPTRRGTGWLLRRKRFYIRHDQRKFGRNMMKGKGMPQSASSGGPVPAGQAASRHGFKTGQHGRADGYILQGKELEFWGKSKPERQINLPPSYLRSWNKGIHCSKKKKSLHNTHIVPTL